MVEIEGIFIRNQDIDLIEYEADDTGVLVYVANTEEIHIFNDTAYFIYKLLEKSRNIQEILEALKNEYEIIEEKAVLSDMLNYLDMLIEKKIITKCS